MVSLESGIVFEGTTGVYELIYLLFSIPNEQERTRNLRIHSGIQEIFFIAVLIYEMTDIISERPGLKTDMDSKRPRPEACFSKVPKMDQLLVKGNVIRIILNSLSTH